MPEPGAVEGDLVWGVLDSFVTYVRAVGGHVTVAPPAVETADGCFRFPLLSVDDGQARFAGGVRFEAHAGALALDISEPWLSSNGTLSVRGTHAMNSEGRRLPFAVVHPDNSAELTPEAIVAFDFRYPAGTALAPVDFLRSH
ncbi:HtaA domain-containing protein [Streptomyces sp. NPDC051286]|uniref:HtaA domain-containing protein n=1 Tax=Streptomyces sp. NPDC051286 TaxID=3365647 RepID=UPI003791709C